MTTRTAQELIKSAYKDIGVIDAQETPDSYLMADGLSTLQDMLSAFSVDEFNLYYLDTINTILTAGDGSFSIGEDGTPDWDTPRPFDIKSAYINAGSDVTVDIIDIKEWNRLSDKNHTGIPSKLYYNPEYPNGIINLYPAPAAAYTLYCTVGARFTELTTLTQAAEFPPEYNEFIRYNLGIRLSVPAGIPVSIEHAAFAKAARTKIMTLNAANQVGVVPIELANLINRKGGYNINRGY